MGARRCTRSSVVGSRWIRASTTSHPTSDGTCRCGCSPACTIWCSAARRPGTISTAHSIRHADFLARWTAEQDVQTNEVQRSWGLLPAFLAVSDGRPLDLLELGPSAGLNLVWDHYRYRYRTGEWGEGTLELAGDDRMPPPAELLERSVEVIRRRGVDLNPVDVTTERGSRLLQAFVWADQEVRLDRLRRAIDVVRHDPPQLMQGDYVDALPSLLRNRRDGAQLIVFQTASTMYLDRSSADRLRAALREAGREDPLVFITTGRAPDDDGFALEVERFPGGGSDASRSSTSTAPGSTGADSD